MSEPKDICIDCDGSGQYPSGMQCKSCGGTGLVPAGDGIPDDDDGQPDEAQEWHDFDPDC